MEALGGLGGIIAIIILLWASSSGGSKKHNSRYEKQETADPNYFKVWDYETQSDAFIGTSQQCDDYIARNS